MENRKRLPYRHSPDVEAMQVENEWLLLHADRYTVTRLNPVGGLCWSLLGQSRTAGELADEVLKKYEISRQEAESDLEDFLGQLHALGLIDHAE